MKPGKLKNILAYYKPYKKTLILDLFFAFTASATVLVYPLLVRRITKEAISTSGIALDIVMQTAIIFLILMVVEYVSNFYISYQGHVMGAKIEFDMRNDLFSHFQKLSFSYFDNAKIGQLMSRITTDLFEITELSHHGPEDIIISAVKFIGAFIILFNVNWVLTLLIFAIIPFMGMFSWHNNKKMKAAFKRSRHQIGEINARIEDSLSGVRVVKSFTNESLEIKKFRKENGFFVDCRRQSYYCMSVFHSGLSAFISLINLVVVVAGALFIYKKIFGLPELITFLLYVNMLIDPVRRFITFTEQFQNGATGFERFLDILAINPDIQDVEGAKELESVKGDVRLEHVGFKYADVTDYVLRNINLSVKAGEYIALVGMSGVGKTTLCSLIPRFYEVSEGTIFIDDKDIKELTLKSLRAHIGIVQQDVYLFSGSVKENIRYGKPDATDDEIVAASKNANAHDFIMALPQGYDTDVGQRGIKLSGGQKQRVSIARVFLKNPSILIFDEATSALDNESEKVVQESFESLAKNRTTFVIAHRLSTIKNAGRIVVLTESGIGEEGNHEDLLKIDGLYAKLYNMQFKNIFQ